MATSIAPVINLWELRHNQAAECFALLVRVENLVRANGEPYRKAHFRARHETRPAMIWASTPMFDDSATWEIGRPYWLRVVGEIHPTFGSQLKLQAIEPAEGREGFDLSALIPASDFRPAWLFLGIGEAIKEHVSDPYLKQLLRILIRQNETLFKEIPAAERMHHAFNAGLMEHVWSLTQLCVLLGDHYAAYYSQLNPPLDKGLLVTLAVLHDIGKLRELRYEAYEASYTTEGRLIGHIVIGRDMVREAAAQVSGFPGETLLRLEHAILAHHGKREFGAPVLPQTLEALIFSTLDDLDAKVNAVARELMRPSDDEHFTNRVGALENRRFYKGPPSPPHETGNGEAPGLFSP